MWVIHNSLFDMRRLKIEGCQLNGPIWDTMLVARMLYNKEFSYSLDNCLKRMGLAKNDVVAEYVKEHKLYTNVEVVGKKTKEKLLHYDKVPFLSCMSMVYRTSTLPINYTYSRRLDYQKIR